MGSAQQDKHTGMAVAMISTMRFVFGAMMMRSSDV